MSATQPSVQKQLTTAGDAPLTQFHLLHYAFIACGCMRSTRLRKLVYDECCCIEEPAALTRTMLCSRSKHIAENDGCVRGTIHPSNHRTTEASKGLFRSAKVMGARWGNCPSSNLHPSIRLAHIYQVVMTYPSFCSTRADLCGRPCM